MDLMRILPRISTYFGSRQRIWGAVAAVLAMSSTAALFAQSGVRGGPAVAPRGSANQRGPVTRATSMADIIEAEESQQQPVARRSGRTAGSALSSIYSEAVGTSVRPQMASARQYVPRHEQMGFGSGRAMSRFVTEPEVIERGVPVPRASRGVPSGGIEFEHTPMLDGEILDGAVADDCGGCGGCSSCCGDNWCCIPCPRLCWDNLQIFGGVQGFTGPPNRGSTGSFGFHEGANFSGPLPIFGCGQFGWQVGTRITQSNLSGADFTSEQRNQVFVTAGLFRRVDWGWQFGAAYDWLHEDWYYESNVGQVRGELSWVFPCKHEFGFWFASAAMTDDVTTTTRVVNGTAPVIENTTWTSTDLYAFFYRRRFGECDEGTARLFAGFTGESDGYIGADAQIPICHNFAFQAGFSYLIPEESTGAAGNLNAAHAQESWNLALSLIWYPGCQSGNSKSYYRPLFNVADNGVFMLDRK